MLHCLTSFPPVFCPKRALQEHFNEASSSTFRNSKFHCKTNAIFSSGFFKVESPTFVKQYPATMHIYSNKKGAEHILDFDFLLAITPKNPQKRTERKPGRQEKVNPDRVTSTQAKHCLCSSMPRLKQDTIATFYNKIRFIG